MKSITAELVDESGKADAKGRRIVSREQKEAILTKYKASGLTQKVFARQEGLKYCTFMSWLGRQRREAMPAKSTFTEVGVMAGLQSNGLELVLPNGMMVRGLSLAQITELLGKLPR